MYQCSSFLLFILLLVGSASARVDIFEQLESFHVRKGLKLLNPEQLLTTYDIAKDNGRDNKSNCERDVVLYKEAIGRNEPWAVRMLDSSSKELSGILRGNIVDLGTYEECIAVQTSKIHGRLCTYTVRPNATDFLFPIDAKLSICLPDSCTNRDVIELLNGAINSSSELKKLGLIVTSTSCTSSTINELSRWKILLLFIISIYTAFLIICTWLDISRRQSESYNELQHKPLSILVRFSLLRSVESIFNLKSPVGDLPFIHGIRAITMFWIALGHEYGLRLIGPIKDSKTLAEWYTTWTSLITFFGFQAVDTFLILSGFFIAYNFFMKTKKKNTFINIFHFYIHRYIRLTLPPMMLLFFGTLIFPMIASGPEVAPIRNMFFEKCSAKWWSILLYVYNYVDCENFCFLHLWSLSIDMQLYWISPFILYALYKKPKVGLAILGLLISGSMLIKGAVVARNNYSAIYVSHIPNPTGIIQSLGEMYIQTYTRATSWLVGFYLGYELATINIKPTKNIIIAGWSLATLAFIFCIGGTRYFLLENYEYNIYWETLYAPFAKLTWSFGIGWVIYACYYDAAGVISKILSWKYFRPLSKLSYCFYLVHVFMPLLRIALSRTAIIWDNVFILYSFIGNSLLSIVFALIVCIHFEMPMLILDSLLFKEKIAVQEKKNGEISNSIKMLKKLN